MIKKYPDELTIDQFDDIKWNSVKTFGYDDDRYLHEIVEEVIQYATKIGGQIYTQVDGDNDILYSKGMRFVNRTGIYEVVKLKDFEVDNS